MRGDAVEGDVHLLQAVAVFGAETLPARGLGDGLQCAEIDLCFAFGIRVADADGMNHHAFGCRHRCCTGRGDGAAGVIAIGEQDQHFLLLMGLIKQFQAQTDGVTQCSIGASHADTGVFEQQ